jgi:iron complex transport system ATP-binding protein
MTVSEPALLDLQNITVMRGEKVVLEDLSLVIRGDEHVAILGPNGCGKSTLIKTITRECYPVAREGSSMTILGQDRWDVFELRSMLGIVSNDLMSKSSGDASGRDVVLSGFFSSARIFPHHVVDPTHRELADTALAQLQITHLAQRPVREMSSGEARRVLIARALVHKPRALLFDEPSNSLDVFARHTLRQSMSSLAKAGIGMILVTHDLSDLIPEIERVLLMSNGRIIADGPKDRMLQSDRLEGLFKTKVEVDQRNGYFHLW